MTQTPPTSPNLVVQLGTALNATTQGAVFIHIEPPIDADATFASASDAVPPSQLAVKNFLLATYLPLVTALPIYVNNAAAVTGGLAVGKFYRTGGDPDHVCVVH